MKVQECPIFKVKSIWDKIMIWALVYFFTGCLVTICVYWLTGDKLLGDLGVKITLIAMPVLLACWAKKEIFG